MTAKVLADHGDLGLSEGAEIVLNSAQAEDPNLVIRNLWVGDHFTDTPRCPPGSLVTFQGCKLGKDDVVETSSFVIDEVAPDPEAATNP